ncbi:MAG: GH3 auxin-responsive promoter family protein [Bacteroidota bacterium]|nr:GH3 auxin-responsive promoter family protein [Bacteroidota bacterium]MDP3143924.1 GH3 auxin-responsive promoter family protein [Bacteroidota bacterium]MDP3557578.1 GH3 auxin-responsive promoter family protein [Bacteroidota bacterium]
MAIINSIASWLMKKRMHQIELFIKYPVDVQSEWMISLLNSAANTEYGRANNFSEIKTYRQFKEQVPINDYESLKPLIERTRRGEQNLFWNSDIKWFAKSSGTTDKSKFLPVSKESLDGCHYNAGRDMITLHCYNNPETQLFTGKNLALGGSFKKDVFGDYISFHGDVSAIIMQNLPVWADFFRAPDISIALMDEWESKLEKMTLSMMNENVASLAGVPSWMMVLLKRILEKKNVKTIHEVWPNLEVYFHGGVSFAPYKEQFIKLFDNDKINFLQLYSASEGFFGIQDQLKSDELLLMLDYGIFYEFIELADWQNKNFTKVINLEDVKVGIDYAIIISTNAGLWRYQLGDVIRFTSTNPYRFKISGRTKQYINVFGEELMVHNVDNAIAVACEKTHALVKDYTVAPIFMDNNSGAHEWLIEFEKEPNNFEFFTALLDESLKKQNSDYEAKRYNNFVLHFPEVKKMPVNTFYNWLKKNNKLGGQFKVPRLSNDRKLIEEILIIND